MLSLYDVLVPETVLTELREVASYADEHGRAAETVLARVDATTARSVSLDVDIRLVTTPTLLSVLVRTDQLASAEAVDLLDAIRRPRSWDSNSYVRWARTLLEETD